MFYSTLFSMFKPESEAFQQHIGSVLSFVFFRHPFSRIASAYHDKMVVSIQENRVGWVHKYAQYIIRKYRNGELSEIVTRLFLT